MYVQQVGLLFLFVQTSLLVLSNNSVNCEVSTSTTDTSELEDASEAPGESDLSVTYSENNDTQIQLNSTHLTEGGNGTEAGDVDDSSTIENRFIIRVQCNRGYLKINGACKKNELLRTLENGEVRARSPARAPLLAGLLLALVTACP